MTNRLLQLGNRRGQSCDGLLQSSYSTLAGLEGGLLETGQGLEIHDLILQEMDIFQVTVDTVMRHLPLLPKNDIVLLDGVFDHVGSC